MSTSRIATPSAAASGSFTLGGDLKIRRLGFGAMRLTGAGIWGEPRDRDKCIAVLKSALDLGVTLIDTADSYGPEVSEQIIAEALYPYPENFVIATKAGLVRPAPGRWEPDCRPQHLRAAVEGSLKRLRLERIDLLQLHTVDPKLPYSEQIGALVELQREGKIRHIGVSNVDLHELEEARQLGTIVSVQNEYNLINRESQDVLGYCLRANLGFIPWFPLATGDLARAGGPLTEVAHRRRATPAQVALAWLLAESPVMLPIPGTASVEHLKENVAAAGLTLSDEDLAALGAEHQRLS
jgi:aryl-alcohol dehydrogenase-like predicted oxidoreductase